MTRVAAVQMASGPNVSANLTEAERWIGQAAEAGAKLIVLTENFAIIGMKEEEKVNVKEEEGSGQIQDFLKNQAARHGVWIIAGTIPLAASDEKRIRAACLVYNDQGEQVARYDKVHLFDVHVPNTDETYNESETIEPGNQAVVIDTPFGKLGLAICYDLRFPELFRRMVDDGVEIIALPSAFTAITGAAHWESLIRSRAIENLSYLIASAQGGYHVNGRETYGDSMVVDPWGNILDRLSRGSGFVMAEIDRDKVINTRKNFPALEHRKIPCSITEV
jgi:nitrilase